MNKKCYYCSSLGYTCAYCDPRSLWKKSEKQLLQLEIKQLKQELKSKIQKLNKAR